MWFVAVIEPTSINERSEYSPSRLSGRISTSPAPPIEEVQENNHTQCYTTTDPQQPEYTTTATKQPDYTTAAGGGNKAQSDYTYNQTDSAYSSTDKSDSKSDSFVIEDQPLDSVPRQYSQPELFWTFVRK